MAELLPFRALRYDEQIAGPLAAVICPPYDIIDEPLRDRLYRQSPHNLVGVELGRDGPERYAAAHQALDQWRRAGILRQDPVEGYYLSEHLFNRDGRPARRRGVFGALRLSEPGTGEVLPHERTFPKAKADRLALLRATGVNTSPVFGMVGTTALGPAIERWIGDGLARPLAEAQVGPEQHRLWVIDEPGAVAALRAMLSGERVYIADGHHRYETALTHHRETADQPGAAAVLTYVCALDDPGLWIRPTHRLIAGGARAIDDVLRNSFDSTEVAAAADPDALVLVRGGSALRLRVRERAVATLPEAWRDLPVAHGELIVGPIRDAGGVVTYEHDTAAALRRAGDEEAVLLVPPVSARDLQRVADAGERLPEKTTYFFPKVPAGLVLRALDDGGR